KDGAAHGIAGRVAGASISAQGLVVGESTAGDGQRTEIRERAADGAADPAQRAGAGIADDLIVVQDVVGERQDAEIQDRTARSGELPLARPSVIVIPAMVTVTPPLISKMRLASLPLTVSWFAPGPSMSRFLVMASSPLVSVMVWPRRLGAKLMVSPLWAAAISPRSEPSPATPVSRLLVTVSVLGTQRSSRASRCGRKEPWRWRTVGAGRLCRRGAREEPANRVSNRERNHMGISFAMWSAKQWLDIVPGAQT